MGLFALWGGGSSTSSTSSTSPPVEHGGPSVGALGCPRVTHPASLTMSSKEIANAWSAQVDSKMGRHVKGTFEVADWLLAPCSSSGRLHSPHTPAVCTMPHRKYWCTPHQYTVLQARATALLPQSSTGAQCPAPGKSGALQRFGFRCPSCIAGRLRNRWAGPHALRRCLHRWQTGPQWSFDCNRSPPAQHPLLP